MWAHVGTQFALDKRSDLIRLVNYCLQFGGGWNSTCGDDNGLGVCHVKIKKRVRRKRQQEYSDCVFVSVKNTLPRGPLYGNISPRFSFLCGIKRNSSYFLRTEGDMWYFTYKKLNTEYKVSVKRDSEKNRGNDKKIVKSEWVKEWDSVALRKSSAFGVKESLSWTGNKLILLQSE